MGIRTIKPSRMATFLKVLTFLVSCICWQQAGHACSVHDHGCIFHAFGSTVSTSNAVTTGPSTLHIYAIGSTPTTGTPSTVDFDNKVLLPGLTSNLFDRVYYQPTGPYIVNSTSYGAANPPPDWNPGGNDGARQVYPSQYKVTFNANTAQARHTGDLNGGENGNIPGATGCPNMPGAANCEAVVVTGNVPSGIYEQRVRIFNYYGVPNPQVDIQAGAYVTGSGVLVSGTHIPTQGGKEIAHFSTLSGNGAITDTYKYEFYDRGFDPHASGVAGFDRNRSHMKTTAVTTGDHRVTSTYRNTLTTRTTIQGNGQFDQHSWTTSKLVRRTVEEIAKPKQVHQTPTLPPPGQTPFLSDANSHLLTGQGSLLAKKTQLQLPKLYAGEKCTEESQNNAILTAWKPYQIVINGRVVTYTQEDLNRFSAYQQYGVISIPLQDRISRCTDAGGNSILCELSFGLEAMARNLPVSQSVGRPPTSLPPKQGSPYIISTSPTPQGSAKIIVNTSNKTSTLLPRMEATNNTTAAVRAKVANISVTPYIEASNNISTDYSYFIKPTGNGWFVGERRIINKNSNEVTVWDDFYFPNPALFEKDHPLGIPTMHFHINNLTGYSHYKAPTGTVIPLNH